MRASATGSGTATWSRPWRRSRGWAPPTAPSRCGARAAGRWRLGDETMGMDLMVILPIGSMYGIYANIWGILMVNVTTII